MPYPSLSAIEKAVCPFLARASGDAPLATNKSTILTWPWYEVSKLITNDIYYANHFQVRMIDLVLKMRERSVFKKAKQHDVPEVDEYKKPLYGGVNIFLQLDAGKI